MRVFSMRVIYQGGPKQDLDQEHSLLKVSGEWWVGVSWIIASVADSMLFSPALVLDRAIAPFLAVSFPTLSDAH